MHCFLVRGLNNRLYTVQLYPQKCFCGSSKSCRHIEACNIAVGKPTNKQKKMFNLSVLKRNARGKNKAGRKFPRSNFEFQYTPAADSHSASESKHLFPLFTSTPKKNQSPVITSANKPSSCAIESTDEITFVDPPPPPPPPPPGQDFNFQ